MSFTLTVKNETAQFMNRVAGLIAPDEILKVAGEAVGNRLRAHFEELQQSWPNQHHWPRQNFWAQAARSVKNDSHQGVISLTIDRPGVALLFYGGTVKPKSSQWLTIPASADAYGHTARDFGHSLQFGFAINEYGRLQPALMERTQRTVATNRAHQTTGSKSKTVSSSHSKTTAASLTEHVKFWLTKETDHPANPEVLPIDAELSQVATEAAEKFINEKLSTLRSTGK